MNWEKILYVVTDSHIVKLSATETVELALKGGAGAVQLRDKSAARPDLIAIGRSLLTITQKYGVPLIVNDDVFAALEIGADGVHLGQSDMPITTARDIANKYVDGKARGDLIIGVSATTYEVAVAADGAGADYIGVGPIFPTASKEDAAKPLGIEELTMIVRDIKAPVIAIGGINSSNIAEVVGTGCAGVAVISAVMGVDDPESAARDLVTRMHS